MWNIPSFIKYSYKIKRATKYIHKMKFQKYNKTFIYFQLTTSC